MTASTDSGPTRRTLAALGAFAKLRYGLGAFVDGVTSNALNFFLMYYATVVCGLGGTKAGIALSAGLVVDAVVDPMIGSLSDRCRSRLGRRLPYMLAGLPIVSVALILIFSVPADLGEDGRFAFLLAMSILLRSSISLFNLPYLAFGAEISDDYAERSSLAAWRWGLGMLGGLITILLGFGLFFAGPAGTTDRAAYTPFAAALALVMLAAAALSLFEIWRLRHRAHHDDQAEVSHLAGMAEAIQDRTFRILFVSTILLFVGQGVTFTLSLHVNTYFWRLPPASIRIVSVALLGGLLAGAPLIGRMARGMEKKRLLLISLVLLVQTQADPVIVHLLGLMPRDMDRLVPILTANAILSGLAITGAVIAMSSMLADVADQHELHNGHRREGLLFAGWSFASKAAGGAGALFAGMALDYIRFPAGSAIRPEMLPSATIAGLGIAAGPAAAVFSVLGIAIMTRYRLTRAEHRIIVAKLGR